MLSLRLILLHGLERSIGMSLPAGVACSAPHVSRLYRFGAHHVGTSAGPGGSTFFKEDFHGTIGYEMEAGTDLRSDNRFVFEPLQAMTSLSESPVLKEPSNWDVICDIGTSIKQANVMPNFAIVYNNNG